MTVYNVVIKPETYERVKRYGVPVRILLGEYVIFITRGWVKVEQIEYWVLRGYSVVNFNVNEFTLADLYPENNRVPAVETRYGDKILLTCKPTEVPPLEKGGEAS